MSQTKFKTNTEDVRHDLKRNISSVLSGTIMLNREIPRDRLNSKIKDILEEMAIQCENTLKIVDDFFTNNENKKKTIKLEVNMIKLIKKTWYLFLILVGSTSYANINRFSGCYEKAMEYSSDDLIDSSLDYCAELDLNKLEKLGQRYTNTKSLKRNLR